MKRMKKLLLSTFLGMAVLSLLAVTPAFASLTLSVSADRDAYVNSNYPDSAFDGGGMEIAAQTPVQDRLLEAIFSFNTASIASQLNSQWVIKSVSVTLCSNYPTAGGQANNGAFNIIAPGFFTLSWLSNDSWPELVTYNTISAYLPGFGAGNRMETLGTYYYPANGTSPLTWGFSLSPGLLGDLLSGSEITIFGTPADTSVGYLFNQIRKGVPPVLVVTADAAPVPIPSAFLLFGPAIAGLGFIRRRLRNADARPVNSKTNPKGGEI